MEAKHTPGPWFIVDNRDLNASLWIAVEHPEVGTVSHAEVRAGCDEAGELGDPEANARLISAAPDLLEALKELRSVGNNMAARRAARAKADAAISKATAQPSGGDR